MGTFFCPSFFHFLLNSDKLGINVTRRVPSTQISKNWFSPIMTSQGNLQKWYLVDKNFSNSYSSPVFRARTLNIFWDLISPQGPLIYMWSLRFFPQFFWSAPIVENGVFGTLEVRKKIEGKSQKFHMQISGPWGLICSQQWLGCNAKNQGGVGMWFFVFVNPKTFLYIFGIPLRRRNGRKSIDILVEGTYLVRLIPSLSKSNEKWKN